MWKSLMIGDHEVSIPLVQGGMAVGVSTPAMSGTVSRLGGLGVLAAALLEKIWSIRLDRKVEIEEAVFLEVNETRKIAGENKIIAINIMVALRHFEAYVKAAVKAEVDIIICGAGLPLDLPGIVEKAKQEYGVAKNIALVPIVSSAQATGIIIRKWQKNYNKFPDAFIIEGFKAGGHLGCSKIEDVSDPKKSLENIFLETKTLLNSYQKYIPIIVAGGIFYHQDMEYWIKTVGADGVQCGTVFICSKECGFTLETKKLILKCKTEKDIEILHKGFLRSSSCGLPFREIIYSPARKDIRATTCPYGALLRKNLDGKWSCLAITDPENYFCICRALMAVIGYDDFSYAIITSGSNGFKIKKIEKTKTIFNRIVYG